MACNIRTVRSGSYSTPALRDIRVLTGSSIGRLPWGMGSRVLISSPDGPPGQRRGELRVLQVPMNWLAGAEQWSSIASLRGWRPWLLRRHLTCSTALSQKGCLRAPSPRTRRTPGTSRKPIIRFEAESFHTLPDSIPHNLNPSHHRLSSERVVGIAVSSHGEPRSLYPNSRPLEVPKDFSLRSCTQLAIGLNTPAPPE